MTKTKLEARTITNWSEFVTNGRQDLLESIENLNRITQEHEIINGKINRFIVNCKSRTYSLETDLWNQVLTLTIRDENNSIAYQIEVEKETFESFEIWENPTYENEWYFKLELLGEITITFNIYGYSWEN